LIVQTCVLALLWLGEALWPVFERSDRAVAIKARVHNVTLGLINGAIGAAFAVLTLLVTLWASLHGFGLLRVLRHWSPETLATEIGLFVGALVVLDLWHYVFHVAAHKVPVLWRFHLVHHHDPLMQATTAMRFHGVEIAAQCLLSLPVYVLIGVDLIHVLAYQLVLLPTALFHHANIRLPVRLDSALRWLIVTPRMHIVHHSAWQPETDSNYAAVLSLWDRLFGTYRWRDRPDSIQIGLEGYEPEETSTLRGILRTPCSPSKAGPGSRPNDSLLPDAERRDA